ncbi:MAG TPA: hypothetical protein VGO18_37095, partial [Steroidobacteraceae bacterium]|nr:hypothetical protein [Steroidobacteraceae bacterium]
MAAEAQSASLEDISTRPGRDTIVSSIVRWTFISLSLLFLAALLFAPLATVFVMAFEKGWRAYVQSFS